MVKFNDPNDGNKAALNQPLLESVFNAIQDGICVLDPNLTILRANATLEKWYSHVPNLVGGKCYQVFHGMDQPCENCPSQRALAHKSPQSDTIPHRGIIPLRGIMPFKAPGREQGWMEVFAYPLLADDGSVSGVVETIRDITQSVEQQNALQRRLASEALITDISSRFINKPHDEVDAEIERSLQISSEFTRSDCCFFKLLQVNGAEIDRLYQWCAPGCELAPHQPGTLFTEQFGWLMAKLEGGESILLHSLAELPPEAQAESEHLKQLGVRSMAAIPILHQNSLAGLLCFIKARQDGEWVTEDIRLLQLLANIFFNAIVHSQEEQLLLRRSAILEAVRLTAEYFLASSDWRDCIQEVLRCLGEASAVSRVYLFENHQAEDATHLTSQRFEWCAPGVEPQINNPRLQNAPLSAPEFALLSKTVGRGETICGLTMDFTGPERTILEAQGIRSIVIVPVNVMGVWWGFVGFDDCLSERAWHPAEIGSLQAAATILGASIQRQLIAESLLQSRRRYRSLFEDSPISLWEQDFSGVLEILTALKQAGVEDLRSHLQERPETVTACMNAIRVINANQATIDLYHIENEQQFRVNLSSFFSSEAADVFIEELVAIAEGKTRFESQSVNYKASGERMDILLKWSVAPGFEGSLQKVYISIQDITEAVRVENELRQQSAFAEALGKVAAAINNTLSLDEVLERILNLVDEVVPHNIASLALVDAGIISQVRTRGFNQASQEKFLNSWRLPVNGTPISRQMAETGQAVVVPDTWQDPDWIIIEERKWVRSFAGAPIQINNETAGFIFLDSATSGFFKLEHAARLQAFAHHAAIAIHNARLFESARQLAHNLQLLNDIIQAALETTSVQSMLQTLADNLGNLLNADGAFITLWDETRQLTIPAAAYGALRDTYPRFIPTPGELTLTSSVLSAGKPIAIEDVSNSPYINPSITMNFSTKSLLGIPLMTGGRKLGGALIAFDQAHQFQPDEIELAKQAARPIALAVYKMQLFEAEQQQRKLAEALRDSAMALNSTHNLDELLQHILVDASTVVPNDAVNIMMLEDGVLRITHWIGYEGTGLEEHLKSFCHPISRFASFQTMINTGEPLIIADILEYPQWVNLEEGAWIRCLLSCPITIRSETIGFINLNSVTPGFFTAEHASRLQAFASQAAIAIENSRLFEEIRRLAIVDALTEVFNRSYFEAELKRLQKSRLVPISILMTDVDGLKEVNDTLGHAAGDELLRRAARILQSVLRAEDIIARIGGDEFAALLPEVDHTTAIGLVKRLQRAIREHNTLNPNPPLALSIGAATSQQGELLFETLKQADADMYRVKQQSGRSGRTDDAL